MHKSKAIDVHKWDGIGKDLNKLPINDIEGRAS